MKKTVIIREKRHPYYENKPIWEVIMLENIVFGESYKNQMSGYAQFDDRTVYDKDVADFVNEHLKIEDRLNIYKITESVLLAFCMLSGSVEIPTKKDWKF